MIDFECDMEIGGIFYYSGWVDNFWLMSVIWFGDIVWIVFFYLEFSGILDIVEFIFMISVVFCDEDFVVR